MGAIQQAMLAIPAADGGSISSPSDLADIWEWWEPELEGLADNDPISTLTGQVSPGAGHNWTASLTLRPTYKTNIINGLAVARYDGTNDDMTGVDVTGLTAAHLFLVVKLDADPPAAGKFGLWLFGGAACTYPRSDSTTQIRDCSFRGSSLRDFSKSGIDLAQWRVVEVVSTSSEWLYLLDGTQLDSTATAFVNPGNVCRLGRAGAFVNQWLDGDIAGLYIMSAKLSSGDRSAMVGYLNSRFGLSIS